MLGQATDHRFPVERHAPGSLARNLPLVCFFLHSNRGQTLSQTFVRGLSTKFRDLNTVTMQLNPGKLLKIKKRQSGI